MVSTQPTISMTSSLSHGMDLKNNEPVLPDPSEAGKADESEEDKRLEEGKVLDEDDEDGDEEPEESDELPESERAWRETQRSTAALRMQFEIYTLGHCAPLEQGDLIGDDDPTFSQVPWELPWRDTDMHLWDDDTRSTSSGMGWFLPSPPASEAGDDDAMSFYSSCESENKDDEAVLGPTCQPDGQNKKTEDAAPAAWLNDKGKIAPKKFQRTCYFMKLPTEIRCLIYKYCLPPKDRTLVCMWPTKPRDPWPRTPVSPEEPIDNQLPSFSSNLHNYPLNGRRWAPIQRERKFVGQTILAVNRLIYAEASQDFYSSHTFRFNSRQIESQDICSGLMSRLRNIEVEDAVFRFSQESIEAQMILLSSNANLKRLVIGPRTAEGLFSMSRRPKPPVGHVAPIPKAKVIKPFASTMYNAQYFRTKSCPKLPKVVIVELKAKALVSVLQTLGTINGYPTIPGSLLTFDETRYLSEYLSWD